MAIDIRAITEAELDGYVTAVQRGFGSEVQEDEQTRVRRVLGLGNAHAAFDGGRLVGTSGSYGLRMAVPGGADVATAGLTRVTVAPTHRRQGILTSLMANHFDDIGEQGMPLSALWASEASIYGRFGYGPACEAVMVSFDNRAARLRPPDSPDTVELAEAAEAEKIMPDLWERTWRARPGHLARSADWWELRCFPDHEWMRDGASPRRHVIATRDGEPVGYAAYRHKRRWTELDLPDGEIVVGDLVAIDLVAEHTLWWFLANIDLFPRVSAWTLPTDTLLPWLTEDQRTIKRVLTDNIWLRVLDVAAALSARTYDHPGEIVLEVVADHPASSGVFELSIDDDGAGRCRRSDSEPTVRLTPYGLSALYMGSIPPEPLRLAGHLTGEPGAVEALRRSFTWPVAAWCDEMF